MAIYYKGVKVAPDGESLPIDKIGTPSANLDLSNISECVFGTPAHPWEITTPTLINFTDIALPVGYRKIFLIYIKRVNEVAVTWNNIPLENWLYLEIPLLPIGKTREIRIEAMRTEYGITYFGSQGGYYI